MKSIQMQAPLSYGGYEGTVDCWVQMTITGPVTPEAVARLRAYVGFIEAQMLPPVEAQAGDGI